MSNEEHFERSEIVGEEEKHIENRGRETEPDALRLARDESLRDVEGATNPK